MYTYEGRRVENDNRNRQRDEKHSNLIEEELTLNITVYVKDDGFENLKVLKESKIFPTL